MMQKIYLMRKQKSAPWKMPKIWMENLEKWEKLGKINPENPEEFHRN